ncbi:MAG: tetratricopeptide repeat protein [Candidatus Odyssella sp.]|nr:tetratricopeptide repeat protein [Candidatus Odyssella sp.]
MTADEPFAQAMAPGTDVQGYRIRSVLGAGGFGITYLAEHAAIGHQVALKEFLPNGIAARAKTGDTVRPMSPAHQDDFAWGLARFRDEARTLARLKHPAIVAVLNYFEANGTAYCVMEYVAGSTLDARLGPRGTLEADTLAQVVPPLLDGIEAVHAAGFLHRDIKPANILLSDRGAPVLIDFGAARQALGAHSRSLTAILSEGYAPYEQYQRDGDQGPWTDIYALGGTLYRCVTGERPPEATRRIDARIKHKPDPLAPAAQAAAGRYPAPLLAAIDRALAVMESERPQSVAELRALIDRSAPSAASTLIAGAAPARPVSAAATLRPDAPPAAARRRRLWPAMAAVVVVIAGAAAAAYVVVDGRRAEEAEQRRQAADRRKAEEEQRLRREAEQAEERRIAEERKRADEQKKAQEVEARRRREAEEAEERRKAEEKRKAEEDEARRREADEAARKRAEAAREQAEADSRAAFDAYQRGNHDEAIRLSTRAIDSRALAGMALAHAYVSRGHAWFARHKLDSAHADFSAAIGADPASGPAYAMRSVVRRRQGALDLALADADEAVRLLPNFARAYFTRASVYEDMRQYDRAIADYTQAIALDPSHPTAYYFRGRLHETMGNRALAITDYRAVLARKPNDASALGALRRLGAAP